MTEEKPKKRGWKAWLAAAVAAIAKFFGAALSALKFLKLGKILLTATTMLTMIWAFSGRFGWAYAFGLVFLILLHELGHGYAARRKNVPVGTPIFIPFIGAFIALKQPPRSPYEDFFIGAGGPVAGISAALACLFLADYFAPHTGKLLLAVGFSALTMNLFNLIPIGFLDGGRMVSPLGRLEWAIGLPLMILAAYGGLAGGDHFNPIVLMLLIGAVIRAVMAFRPSGKRITKYAQAEVSHEERFIAAGTYFLLAAGGIYLVHAIWESVRL